MTNNDDSPMSPSQMRTLIALLIQSIPIDLSAENAQRWIQSSLALRWELVRLLNRTSLFFGSQGDQFHWWKKFYRESFGINLDIDSIQIPQDHDGFDWLIVVAEGMTAQKVYDKLFILFEGEISKVFGGSLDNLDSKPVRSAKSGAYAIWVGRDLEADAAHLNKSYNNLKAQRVNGITLTECLLLAVLVRKITGMHLNINTTTFCSGSLSSDGEIILISTNSDVLEIGRADRACNEHNLGTRKVIS